jgi:hypothetical protein
MVIINYKNRLIMYRLFKQAVFVLFACALFSCNDVIEQNIPTTFSVIGSIGNVTNSGGEYFLTILSDGGKVEISTPVTWVQTELLEDKRLKVTIAPNPSEDPRDTRITIVGYEALTVDISVIQAGAPKIPKIVGNWQFPASNILAANIGADLEKTGDGFMQKAGPNGRNAVTVAKGSYFLAKHGLAALGGDKVNEYTIMWDVHMDWVASWYSLFNASVTNSNDGDLWIGKGNREIGVSAIGGYLQNVFPDDNAWYRIVLSVRLGESLKIYINGVALDRTWNKLELNNDKYGWDPAGVLLFACSAGDDGDIDVTEVTIWDQALTDSEVAKIGKVGTPYLP